MEGFLQKRGTRLTLLILVGAAALYGIYSLSAIFAPLFFSFIVAYVLDPVADALERRKFTRLAAVITIFGVGIAVLALFFTVTGFYVADGVHQLSEDITGDKVYRDAEVRRLPVDPPEYYADVDESGDYNAENDRLVKRIPDLSDRYYFDADGNAKYDPRIDSTYLIGELSQVLVEPPKYYSDENGSGAYEFLSDKRVMPIPDQPGQFYLDGNNNDKYDESYLLRAQHFIEDLASEPDPEDEEAKGLSTYQPYFQGFQQWLEKFEEDLQKRDPEEIAASTQDQIGQIWEQIKGRALGRIVGGGGGSDFAGPAPAASQEKKKEGPGLFSKLFTWASWFLLCPLYIFYLLLEIDPLIEKARRLIPGKQRPRVERIFGKVDRTIAAFFRGRLTICVVKGLGTSIGLMICGVPFALPLGIAAGFLALVPYVGIWFSIIPTLILAWLDAGTITALLAVGGVFAVMEVLEGFVLIPKLLGKEVGLHPLTVIVTMLIFAELLGFIGILLSVPLAAIAKILLEEFVMPLVEEFAAEKPDEKKSPA